MTEKLLTGTLSLNTTNQPNHSVDPDQTAPSFSSTLFAQTWLSKNLGLLQ